VENRAATAQTERIRTGGNKPALIGNFLVRATG
jgi:hypothetical protein